MVGPSWKGTDSLHFIFPQLRAAFAISAQPKVTTTHKNNKSNMEEASSAQNKADASVKKTKIFFLVGLGITAILAAAVSGYLVAKSEVRTFEQQYRIYAREIAVRSFQNAAETFSSMRGLGKSLTSHAMNEVVKFPFVTIPNWQERTEEARRVSFDEMMAFVPLVDVEEREQWEFYSGWHQQWIEDGLASEGISFKPPLISDQVKPFPMGVEPEDFVSFVSIMDEISSVQQRNWVTDAYDNGPTLKNKFAPLWQMGPAPTNTSVINTDLLTSPGVQQLLLEVLVNRHGVLSPFSIVGPKLLGKAWRGIDTETVMKVPHSGLIEPVFTSFEEEAPVSGFLVADVPWTSYFLGVLPEGVGKILVVVHDTCGNTEFTIALDGPAVELVGYGDHHDRGYNHLGYFREWKSGPGSVVVDKRDSTEILDAFGAPDYPHHCEFNIAIYPHRSFSYTYLTKRPLIISVCVLAIFFFCAATFFVYDLAVGRRQRRLLLSAQKTSSVVSSLFPKSIQGRVLADAESRIKKQEMEKHFVSSFARNKKQKLKSHLELKSVADDDQLSAFDTKPIADLFPETTLMIADIYGFSAWSSTRDPQQVFTLLETIFQAFDNIAKQHKVYKVEASDQYVAVSGLPEPTKNHALVMAKFAQACLREFEFLTRRLESTLGPDTSELGLRVGLHSGPTIAGVLRGDRSRFQLFGDAVNVCGKIALTSDPNRIQISESTAGLLQQVGKDYWMSEREDEPVVFRGQTPVKTYWLALFHFSGGHSFELTRSLDRMISWNVEVLSDFLKQVVARRMSEAPSASDYLKTKDLEIKLLPQHRWAKVIDEVTEYIDLPRYNKEKSSADVASFELQKIVTDQLHQFVGVIAERHCDNHFHNFEHASHVLLAVVKLLGRVVTPEGVDDGEILHDHTFGITSDPLVSFAVAFAAVIHDVCHPGVSNSILVSEGNDMAIRYHDRSVAEQNSVDMAFTILLQERFTALREAIYQTPDELQRFRKLVVHCVLATDIWDPQLNEMRNDRWNKAFTEMDAYTAPTKENADRKASIVLEHLITASDISHCMQHWAIYIKWNENLFNELFSVYETGRSQQNPAEFWYEAELKFFDQYVIPLAKKLKSCGIFGVSSVEYLDYAIQNRKEWEAQGREMVKGYVNNAIEQASLEE